MFISGENNQTSIMTAIKITSWNVNSVKARLNHLVSFLETFKPDVLLLQEIKIVEEAFPLMEIEELGYNILIAGQKTYNGVAILSKFPLELVTRKLPGEESDEQARYIEAIVSLKGSAIRVASVYVPNGQEVGSEKFQYKLRFFERLYNHINQTLKFGDIFAVGGDYNVAPEAVDVYDPKRLDGTVCFHPEERKWFRKILHSGMYDSFRILKPEAQQFSWWDYRSGAWQYNKGMRIDHVLVSPQAVDLLSDAGVEQSVRGLDKPSDHAPVWCEIKI